jgi:hypothetical protein
MQNREILVRWDYIDMVGLDSHPIFDLDDRHRGIALQQFHHDSLVGGV